MQDFGQQTNEQDSGSMRSRSASLSGLFTINCNFFSFYLHIEHGIFRPNIISVDTSEHFEQNLETLRAILGDDIPEEKIKQALRGADGKVDIALNHLLNDTEKERQSTNTLFVFLFLQKAIQLLMQISHHWRRFFVN